MTSQKSSIVLKEKQVEEFIELIKEARTLMVVSIKSVPSKQFQDIKKAIREYANVKVAKKNILTRALNEFGKDSILKLVEHVDSNCAFIISDKEGYELAALLSKKKTPVFAKAGQEAPEDIEVKGGPTDLVPGPAISELGAQGLQVAVEDGKISIKAPRVVVKKGGTISAELASLLQKLHIQPMKIGLNPVVVYDVDSEKIYTEIKIDSEGFTEELKDASGKALGFAQKIVYYCKDTIGYFLGKANMDGEALDGLDDNGEAPAEGVKGEKKVEVIEGEEVSEQEQSSSSDSTDSENSSKQSFDSSNSANSVPESQEEFEGVPESQEESVDKEEVVEEKTTDDTELNKPEDKA